MCISIKKYILVEQRNQEEKIKKGKKLNTERKPSHLTFSYTAKEES